MSHAFGADVMKRAQRRNRVWYQNNLLTVLEQAKDRQARDVDVSIALAKQLMALYEEKLPKPVVVPLHSPEPFADDSMMRRMDPAVRAILHDSVEKGAAERYLKERNKMSPDEKYFYRVVTSWDYGWQQKASRLRARDVNRGRCALLRDTFYRKNNPAPDPPCVAQPSGGEFSVCAEYSCYFG